MRRAIIVCELAHNDQLAVGLGDCVEEREVFGADETGEIDYSCKLIQKAVEEAGKLHCSWDDPGSKAIVHRAIAIQSDQFELEVGGQPGDQQLIVRQLQERFGPGRIDSGNPRSVRVDERLNKIRSELETVIASTVRIQPANQVVVTGKQLRVVGGQQEDSPVR